MESPPPCSQGLILESTETLARFLRSSSDDEHKIPDDVVRRIARSLSDQPLIPYRSFRTVYLSLPEKSRPPLRRLLAGSGFALSCPKPREKSEELKERLRKLSELEETRAYNELVKDVAQKEEPTETFSSYRDQIGFGLHVVVTMFTGYLVGYAAFRALFGRNQYMSAAGGLFGLVSGMMLETVLFIVRTSSVDIKPSSKSSSFTSRSKKNQ